MSALTIYRIMCVLPHNMRDLPVEERRDTIYRTVRTILSQDTMVGAEEFIDKIIRKLEEIYGCKRY